MDDKVETAEDWEQRSEQRLRSAIHLAQINQREDAYDMAGYAAEFALKAKIMRVERLNQWPSRSARPDLHTHDLLKLAEAAGLRPKIDAEIAGGTDIGKAWMRVKDWTQNARYLRAVDRLTIRDMLWALRADKAGLLRWIETA